VLRILLKSPINFAFHAAIKSTSIDERIRSACIYIASRHRDNRGKPGGRSLEAREKSETGSAAGESFTAFTL